MDQAMKRSIRREQLEWLKRKKGSSYLQGFEYMTDQEVARHYEQVYPLYSRLPDLPDAPTATALCPTCRKPLTLGKGKHPFPIDLKEFAREQSI